MSVGNLMYFEAVSRTRPLAPEVEGLSLATEGDPYSVAAGPPATLLRSDVPEMSPSSNW